MDTNIRLISHGDGLAVIDLRSAVQRAFFQSLDLRRPGPLNLDATIDSHLGWVHDQSR